MLPLDLFISETVDLKNYVRFLPRISTLGIISLKEITFPSSTSAAETTLPFEFMTVVCH